MCGIAGILDGGAETTTMVEAMCARLLHRGPDGLRVVSRPGAVLGHTRLSVIDMETGWQPISNEDGTIWVVLNGEIYNFLELRTELEQKGHRFSTKSDTEVLVHLYEEAGAALVERLRGMFAFALWDERRRQLVLARDRIGKKPLYYTDANGRLMFASELQALVGGTDVPRTIDPTAIDQYLSYGYIPAPRSILKQVRKLPPAHVLVANDGGASLSRYWELAFNPKAPASEQDLFDAARAQVEDATRARLVADVPLGFLLSGGIDSSAVVAAAASMSPSPLHTFSIGFARESFDESPYARLVAERFGTRHEELIVEGSMITSVHDALGMCDEPLADASVVPMYLVSKLARDKVTVALGGDGGDEAFAGYDRYLALKMAAAYYRMPYAARASVLSPIARLLPETTQKLDRVRRVKRFFTPTFRTLREQYTRWLHNFRPEERLAMYAPSFRAHLEHEGGTTDVVLDAFASSTSRSLLAQAQQVDIATYLPGDLMQKADRMSMAHGLELRSPFLDHRLIEFAATIPDELKLKGFTSKYVLKRAFAGVLPSEVLKRRKEGFSVPIADWLRNELRPWMSGLLLQRSPRIGAIVQPAYIQTLASEHLSGRANHGLHLWTLLCLEAWLDRMNVGLD